MLRDTAVARVKQMLGFKLNLDAEIVQAMIEMQEDLERSSELPFFLRKNYKDFTTFPAPDGVPAPLDFIREDDVDQMFVVDGGGREYPLAKDIEGYLRKRWPVGNGPGFPQRFARVYKNFHFYPIPDDVYFLHGAYYAKDVKLSTNIENKWLLELPQILIARAGLALASGLRDQAGTSVFSSLNEIMTEKLYRMTTADDQAGMRPVIGGDED